MLAVAVGGGGDEVLPGMEREAGPKKDMFIVAGAATTLGNAVDGQVRTRSQLE